MADIAGAPFGGYAQNLIGMRYKSSSLWNKMLEEAMKIQSGEMSPMDLPQFKQFEELFNTQRSKQMQDVFQKASSRGISGGALSSLLSNMDESSTSTLSDAMLKMFSEAKSGVSSTAQGGMENWLNFAKLAASIDQYKKNLEAERKRQISQNIMSGIGMMAGGIAGGMGGGKSGGGGSGGTFNDLFFTQNPDAFSGW